MPPAASSAALRRWGGLLVATLILPACGGGGGGGGGGPVGGPPGSLEAGFGTLGAVVGTAVGTAQSIALDSAWMYVAGNDNGGLSQQWRIEKRSLSDGSLDPVFGTSGVVVSDPTAGADYAYSIMIAGGALHVAGVQDSGGNGAWRIEKRDPITGALDPVFGSGTGAVVADPTSSTDSPTSLLVLGGDLFIVGFEGDPSGSGTDERWRIEKRSAVTGALDGTFGGGTGVVQSNPGTAQDQARAAAADANSLYVAGFQHVFGGDYAWRVEKRDRATGAPDGVFGSGTGVITSNPSTNSRDEAARIAVSAGSIIVAGVHEFGSDRQWRIEKRDAPTGALDAAFGAGSGFVTSNVGTVNESAGGGLLVDGGSLYVGGWYDDTGLLDIAWRIEKRDLSTGSLSASFAPGGFVTSNPTASQDLLLDLAQDSSALFAVGYQSGGGLRWRIEKRWK